MTLINFLRNNIKELKWKTNKSEDCIMSSGIFNSFYQIEYIQRTEMLYQFIITYNNVIIYDGIHLIDDITKMKSKARNHYLNMIKNAFNNKCNI